MSKEDLVMIIVLLTFSTGACFGGLLGFTKGLEHKCLVVK